MGCRCSRRQERRTDHGRADDKSLVLDADGDATTDWTPRVFPTSVLIGRNGKPAAMVLGDLDWSSPAAKELLDPLLAAPRKT